RDDFFELIDSSDGHVIQLYVYNSQLDSCREVHLKPDSNWGGNGLLGCDIGYGYLHRIPTAALASPESSSQLSNNVSNHPRESMKPSTNGESKLPPVSVSSNEITNGVAPPSYPPPAYTSNNTQWNNAFAEVPLVSSSMQPAPSLPPAPLPATYPTQVPINPVDHSDHAYTSVSPSAFTQNSTIAPPAPLPPGLTNMFSMPSQNSPSVVGGGVPVCPSDAPLISFESTKNVVNTPQYSQFNIPHMSSAQYFHPITDNLPTSRVITLPGMPPLDVKMPPLESLNLSTNQSS
ncbi:unnamed protein product, partial [Schistosoma turkestanicum]